MFVPTGAWKPVMCSAKYWLPCPELFDERSKYVDSRSPLTPVIENTSGSARVLPLPLTTQAKSPKPSWLPPQPLPLPAPQPEGSRKFELVSVGPPEMTLKPKLWMPKLESAAKMPGKTDTVNRMSLPTSSMTTLA